MCAATTAPPAAPDTITPLVGFDDHGEPWLENAFGRVYLHFAYFPPFWVPQEEYRTLGRCAEFDKQLAAAIDSPVFWVDRELFHIERPRPDTPARVQKFLIEFRRRHEPR